MNTNKNRRSPASQRHPLRRAADLAQRGDVAGARALVAAHPGPVAVIEIQPRNRVAHQTTPTLVEHFAPPFMVCPRCHEFAICRLPPTLASLQPDGTTAVCHPAHGGCNHGFIVG